MMNTDFLLEKKLAAERPDLSKNFQMVVFTMESVLGKTVSLFPEFTDHTIRHSLIVLEMANQLIGADQVEKMNPDEIYILLCAMYTHDFGMTTSRKNYEKMKDGIVPDHFEEEHPEMEIPDIVRRYHHLFSEKLIYKYAGIFEFPSKEHTYCIAQVAKGHRKVDLYDQNEYNPAYRLPNGNIVRLPYLAALMRLCDEMDITIERNAAISYIEHSEILSYKEHFAIKQLNIAEDRFVIKVETGEPEIRSACTQVIDKLNETLQYCVDVTAKRTDFDIRQKSVEVFMHDLDRKTAIILDSKTDADDAIAFSLIREMGDFKPNFIIAESGNSGASLSVKNAAELKKIFGFNAVIVKGEASEDAEKSCISMEELKTQLTGYDQIIYIASCSSNSFSSLYQDSNLKDKFSRIFISNDGIQGIQGILASGLDITLFPLDLISSQQLNAAEIREMEENHANPDCIAFLKQNFSDNESRSAVLRTALPLLYLCSPEKFKLKEKRLISNENGIIEESDSGAAVKVAAVVEEGLMKQSIMKAVQF